MSANKFDARQSELRAALAMAGTSNPTNLDQIFPIYDAEIAKLFEDRNVLLTDGGNLTFTGTSLSFTTNLNLSINQNVAGATPYVINLGSSSQTFTNSEDMLIATINRTAATGTLSIVASGSAIPAANGTNQEIFLIAKRKDDSDGTQRLYFRNGFVLGAGQTSRLGAASSGGAGGSKNYLSAYTASLSGGLQNIGNGNFEAASTAG